MQFSSFSREVEGLTIKFFNDIPVENVGKIKFYKDNKTGIFSRKEFRWSFNNEYWSSWQPLTQSALSSILTYSNYYFFLEVRYVLTAANSGTVTTFMFDYDLGTATPVTNRILTEDIQHLDSSAVLIHDIIQEYKYVPVLDASLLNKHSGAYYLDRTHHTGQQSIATIQGLESALDSLSSLTSGVFIKEASLGPDFTWVAGYLDVSITATDSSVNYLFLYNEIQDISISLKANLTYVDGSLSLRDASIYYILDNYTTNSSINTAKFIKESSLGSDFVWTGGLLDVSIVSGYSPEYIDGSFAYRDISINNLYSKNLNQDASITSLRVYVDGSLLNRDSSIIDLYNTKVSKTGDTMSGSLRIDSSLLVNGGTLYVDSSNNRIGVRTTLPEAPLHVLSSTGDIMYVQRAGQSKFNLGAGSVSGTSYLRWGLAPSGTSIVIGANGAVEIGGNTHIADINLGDIYVNRYGFFEDGIGIGAGTTIPQYTLDVSGNIHSSGSVVFDSSLWMSNQRIQGVRTPVDPSDATNRWYVDVSIQTLRIEQPWTLDNSVLSPSNADYDIQLSSIQMQTDGGQMTLVDMTITAAEASGNIHSYSFDIDGSKALRIEAVADGSLVGISQKYIVETVDYHYIGEPSADGSWRYFIDASTDLQFQKRVAGIWVNSQKLSV